MTEPNLSRPVIFLVYANDRVDPARHLRNLEQEIGGIRRALRSAEQEGMCEVVFEPNASTDQVMSVFQDARYRGRIAIFHYAGHANGYQLMLESEHGGHAAANADGLAAFLGRQDALQLVFLNGCSTGPQVGGLLETGVPVVIATSEDINDAAAMDFATHFYQGIGGGAELRQCYDEATAAAKTKRQGSGSRGLYWGGAASAAADDQQWPWEFRVQNNDDTASDWNLRDAADNPLFGLPGLPAAIEVPASPFRHLNWFNRNHARVFFGRGTSIRGLYDAVTDPDAASIILFYGQSGVGKSSVLEAGLLPRLETTHQLSYLRREQAQGLLGTLMTAFAEGAAHAADAWRAVEATQGRPLLVVLDQVEEVFTRANSESPNELAEFADALADIFGKPEQRPQGRLIIGFRKEWLPEIEQRIIDRELHHQRVFLETIDRNGVIEAITGPARSPRIRHAYHFSVESGVAEEIADDLLADRESPIAPTLQILLTKLWNQAKEDDYENPRFTRDLYLRLKRDGILLDDFLTQQLDELERWQPGVVKHGLALDVLAYHTTAKGTAAHRTAEELFARYGHTVGLVPSLVQVCKNDYLLAEIPSKTRETINGSRLAHDTLAPLVRERFDESDTRGQRARRILENRAQDWKDGQSGTPLDETDLAMVDSGRADMRDLDANEERLFKSSELARSNRERSRRVWRLLGWIAVISVIAAGAFAGIQWKKADAARVAEKVQKKKAFEERDKAIRQEKINIARRQDSQARELAELYPQHSLLLSIEAGKTIRRDEAFVDSSSFNRTLINTLANHGVPAKIGGNIEYNALYSHQLNSNNPSKIEVEGSEDNVFIIYSTTGWMAELNPYSENSYGDEYPYIELKKFVVKDRSYKSYLKVGASSQLRRLPGLFGKEYDEDLPPEYDVEGPYGKTNFLPMAFSEDGQWFAYQDEYGDIELIELDGKEYLSRHKLEGKTTEAVRLGFSLDNRWLVAWGDTNSIRIWDMGSKSKKPVRTELKGHESRVLRVEIGENNPFIRAEDSREDVRVWSLSEPNPLAEVLVDLIDLVKRFSGNKNVDSGMEIVGTDVDRRWLLVKGDKYLGFVGTSSASLVGRFGSIDENVTVKVAVDSAGRWIVSRDNTLSMVNPDSRDTNPLLLSETEGIVQKISFDPSEQWIYFTTPSGLFRLKNSNNS